MLTQSHLLKRMPDVRKLGVQRFVLVKHVARRFSGSYLSAVMPDMGKPLCKCATRKVCCPLQSRLAARDYKTCPLFLVFVISYLVSSSHHPPPFTRVD